MPATLAETMRIADTYTLGDPMQHLLDSGEPSRRNIGNNRPVQNRNADFGHKRNQSDFQYATHQVAAVTREQDDLVSNQR